MVKEAAVAEGMLRRSGPARVFESEADAVRAIAEGAIAKGSVVVIRYEGPKGAPGMREMLMATSTIAGLGLAGDVALITDGRFSGATRARPSATSPPRRRPAVRSAWSKKGTRSRSTSPPAPSPWT